MAYFSQPIISDFRETPPADTVALTDIDGTACKVYRPPLYDTSGYTVPTKAIWVDQSGSAGSADGSSYANRFGSTKAAIAAGEAGSVSGLWLVVCGPNAGGAGLARYRAPFSNVTVFGASSKFAGMMAAPGALIWFDGSDVLSGWTNTGTDFTHAYTPPMAPPIDPHTTPGKLSAAITASATSLSLSPGVKGAVQILQGSLTGFLIKIGSEWMRVHAVAGGGATLTVNRGVRGTTPVAHASGASVSKCLWPMDRLYVDGVPYVIRLDDAAGAGEFWVDEVAGKIHMADDPTGKTVEAIQRVDINNGAGIGKSGFLFKGIGFQKWAGDASNDNAGVIRFSSSGQGFQDCVLAYMPWLGCAIGDGGVENQVVYINNGMGKHGFSISNYVHTHYRICHSNWDLLIDITPGGAARFAGQKNAATVNCTDDWFLIDKNRANGKWDDVRCKGTLMSHFACVDNIGYGYTQEVGSGAQLVDFFCARNGADHGDNIRVSGMEKPRVYNGTSVDSYGAGFGLYEDSREYTGGTTANRALTPPGLGDTYGTEFRNLVLARTRASAKPPFYSVNGNVAPAGAENSSHGWAQTRTLATEEMFASDPNAGTLDSNDDHNVLIDLTSASGKCWQWATPQNPWGTGSGQTHTTLMDLAAVQALGHGNETGSKEILRAAGTALSLYFPNLASTGDARWSGVATIPTDGRSTDGTTVPNWVADILGISHGATARVGAYNYPIAVAIGATAPVVDTTALPTATIGSAYSTTFTATGGATPYTWTETSSPSTSLSDHGLSMTSGGVLSAPFGTVTGTAKTGDTITVTATDANGATGSHTFAITYAAAPANPTVATTGLPNATIGTSYTATLTATGGSGTYTTWAVTGLANGLTLAASTGVISGTVTGSATTLNLSVTVTDDASHTSTAKALTIAVGAGNQPPTAAWDNTATPANGGTVTGTIRLTINATDDHALPVNAAELWHGATVATLAATGTHLTQGSGNAWYLDYDTTALTDGAHVFRVRVTDSGGLTADTFARNFTVNNGSPSNTPPVPVIDTPTGTVSGTTTIVTTVVDDTDAGPTIAVTYTITDANGVVVKSGTLT